VATRVPGALDAELTALVRELSRRAGRAAGETEARAALAALSAAEQQALPPLGRCCSAGAAARAHGLADIARGVEPHIAAARELGGYYELLAERESEAGSGRASNVERRTQTLDDPHDPRAIPARASSPNHRDPPSVARALGVSLSELEAELDALKIRRKASRLVRGNIFDLPEAQRMAPLDPGPPLRRRPGQRAPPRAPPSPPPAPAEVQEPKTESRTPNARSRPRSSSGSSPRWARGARSWPSGWAGRAAAAAARALRALPRRGPGARAGGSASAISCAPCTSGTTAPRARWQRSWSCRRPSWRKSSRAHAGSAKSRTCASAPAARPAPPPGRGGRALRSSCCRREELFDLGVLDELLADTKLRMQLLWDRLRPDRPARAALDALARELRLPQPTRARRRSFSGFDSFDSTMGSMPIYEFVCESCGRLVERAAKAERPAAGELPRGGVPPLGTVAVSVY